jgi:hypothetical protein
MKSGTEACEFRCQFGFSIGLTRDWPERLPKRPPTKSETIISARILTRTVLNRLANSHWNGRPTASYISQARYVSIAKRDGKHCCDAR